MTRQRILVGMSGGVDSSTAASILLEKGHDVEGATMLFKGVLKEDVESARNACRKLGIRYHTFDFRRAYQNLIINDFITEYQAGRTPNPCVRCNKLFKFGLFLNRAMKLKFDRIATGHYAGVTKKNDEYFLQQGKDRNEQSYFLYRLGQSELSRISLPLARFTKKQVRDLARRIGLKTALREKSQDICFLPDRDYASYLEKVIPTAAGPIIDQRGTVIGTHRGIVFYTYGQRRRLGISHETPYYVTKIDAATNTIQVGGKRDVYNREVVIRDVSFTSGQGPRRSMKVKAKARYFSPLADATVDLLGDSARVIFKKPQWALTPGQSVVFYLNRTVLGGGIIEKITA